MSHLEIHLVSHSKDPDIRQNSSSGGFCKSFLTYLVESNTVDFVIMTRMKEDSTEPESIITNEKQKIITRSNSIYEYHDQTKILKNIETDKKYCFIGLPCFVRYIRNQQIKHNKYKNIFPLISILCNQAPKSSFKNSLMNENNIQIDQVCEIDYRNGKYPGEIIAIMKDGSLKNLGCFRKNWLRFNDPFFKHIPDCCLNCELFESTFADIVVGDPWLTQYEKDTNGWTKIIVRNEESMNLINKGVANNYITIQKLEDNESFLAYKHTKEFKNNAIRS
jgi:coenzyme F420-reducing hydrogenase beta subunit